MNIVNTPTRRLQVELSRLAGIADENVRIGCRSIQVGDENALTPAEFKPLAGSVVAVRRASGAARIVAKQLLWEDGCPARVELVRTPSGGPTWPLGYLGSLTHDHEFAVAVISRESRTAGIGIDIEPALPLPVELLALVATDKERAALDNDLVSARLLFCMKEAVFKATHPRDGIFLDHHDVEICFRSGTATTATGHELVVGTSSWPSLVALAILTKPAFG